MKEVSVVHSDPDILGGTPVFVGTRVPVQALIDYIEGGHSLNEFLDDFPTMAREVAIAPLTTGRGNADLNCRASAASTMRRSPLLHCPGMRPPCSLWRVWDSCA